MANLIETLVASTPIICPADKYYNFFKYDMNDVVKIYPGYTGVEVIEGKEGEVGIVKIWNYVLGGVPMVVTSRTEVIDDAAKTMKIAAIDGDVLQLYKSFSITLIVSEGFAKWNIDYERASPIIPPAELYVPFLVGLCTTVDAHLVAN